MKIKDSVSISVFIEKSKDLLENIREFLDKIGYDTSNVPKDVFEGDKPVSIVFAGQYSAGKSSILKALTGIQNIAIGEGITTQEAHEYDWNGIKVVDTPGIHTTLHPDHDAISYQKIANSDMLVYVVTHELFDDFIGANFRKLLLEKDKAAEMILIVNKMADIGNTVENQEIKLKDLEKVTTPYTPAQLRTVFIDVESYIDSLSEDDEEIAEELRNRSNYDSLIKTLNKFISDKAIPLKMTTVLYQVFEVLQNAMVEYQSSTGDSDIDALEEHLLQERHILLNSQFRIETEVKRIVQEAASKIREKGRKIANSIYDFEDENDAKEAIDNAYKEVDKITDTCIDNVTHRIEELADDCIMQLDQFYKSDFSKDLEFRLENKLKKGNPTIEHFLKSDTIFYTGKKIIANTIGTKSSASGLQIFSGSNIHQKVLDIGHFFGHSFKPWEAVKWARGINVFGKVVGVCGVVFSLGMQIKEDIDKDKIQQEMRKNREELRGSFANAANEVEKYFNNALEKFLKENYVMRVDQIDTHISEIRNMRTNKSETYKMLENLQVKCRNIISDIHKSCVVDVDN